MIQTNVELEPFNTFGLKAKAAKFGRFSTIEELKACLQLKGDLPLMILGGGSNILLTTDYKGLVLKNEIKGVEKIHEDAHYVYVKVGAGEMWHPWVLTAIRNAWFGIENMALIPGTVGAAPMQNIGAYGVEIKDVFESLEAFNLNTGQIEVFDANRCAFGYRESFFKHAGKGQYVILSVCFKLFKSPNLKLSYGDIQKVLTEKNIQSPQALDVAEAVMAIRSSKLPDPAEIGNAGSFFKNPEIRTIDFDKLKEQHLAMPGYQVSPEKTKVPAGWLIEQAGWKGHTRGSIGVHAKQALVLVNYGEGSGAQILALSEDIKASVFEKYGIRLETEVNLL